MKYGIREICDVVLKAKSKQKIGNKVFYKDEPVCYFDSLKTSSLEGAATTVYAQGGRGNSRLVAWEGERTVTFTMEDALISTTGLQLLTGAGLVEPSIKEERTYATEICFSLDSYDNFTTFNDETLTLLTYNLDFDQSKQYFFDANQIEVISYSAEQYEEDDITYLTFSTGETASHICDLSQIIQNYSLKPTSASSDTFGEYINIGTINIDLTKLQEIIGQEIISKNILYINNNGAQVSDYSLSTNDTVYMIKEKNNLGSCGLYFVTTTKNTIPVHVTETTAEFTKNDTSVTIVPKKTLSTESNAGIYVMPLKNGVIYTEPYLGKNIDGKIVIETGNLTLDGITRNYEPDLSEFDKAEALLLDYYTDMDSGVQQIEITPDKFGGNYYLEASTLFRDTNGVDMPAEFIIPNCKIQSNFTFSMASSGDPSTFTFTMDAFPDYTRFDKTKKVLSVIQVITDSEEDKSKVRKSTDSSFTESK